MSEASDSPARRLFRVNDLEIDLDRQSVRRIGELIELPDLSFRLLAVLISRAPDIVAKDDLMREVWGNVVVGDETLAQRVRLLRQALGEDSQNPRYISSVRGRGYRLICDVTAQSAVDSRTSRHWGFGIAAVVTSISVAFWLFTNNADQPSAWARADSIAVLPFTDLSPNQNYGYFADGMHEELLTRLTKLTRLEVLSRTSVEPYRTTDLSLPEIARTIGVRLIIEGSVRIADDRVRITVQLIDAETDLHIWAENFDRELSMQSIFSIQGEVAEQIALALELEYDAAPLSKQDVMPTASLDAYNAFLLGRYHTFRQTPADLALAVVYLEKATELDRQFAEAYASLGWAYSFLGTNYGLQPPRQVYPQAKEAALTALSLDNRLADARSLYADILTWYDWDFAAAEREYLKTVELDPENVLGYALFLSSQKRHDEAIRYIEIRLAADPNDPYVHINAAWRFYSARRYARAIEEANLAGDHADVRSILGFTYLETGETDRAIRIFESDVRMREGNPQPLSNLAYAYFIADQRTKGEQVLAELLNVAQEEFVSPGVIAPVYFGAGDADTGFALLKSAIEVRSREMIFLRVDHTFDDYREDPRYLDLIRTIGFL